MRDLQRDVQIPPNAEWVEITTELLASPEGERWQALADSFEPFDEEPGHEMTRSLRRKIRSREIGLDLHAIYNEHLLGFFELEPVGADISSSERRRRITPNSQGVRFSMVVRSCDTDAGFGRVLLAEAIAQALEDKANEAIYVVAANTEVEALWKRYSFVEVDDPKKEKTLYLALPREFKPQPVEQ
jgi:GNAT superfamily N-acetyltransferase